MTTQHPGQSWRLIAIGFLVWSAAAGVAAQTRGKIYSLVEKTRTAGVIAGGEVAELRGDTIVVRVRSVIKGAPEASMVLTWNRTGTVEQRAAAHAVGDQVIVFANPRPGVYDPLGGAQGTVKLEPSAREPYEIAIRSILAFDAAPASEGKTAALLEMLRGQSRPAQIAALEIAYLEFHTARFATDPLVAPVLRLVQGGTTDVAVPAIQVLGRIGDKTVVAPLIDLMAAPDRSIAETAFTAVKGLTNAPLPFDPRQSRDARAAAAKRWSEWWETNKESVVLVK